MSDVENIVKFILILEIHSSMNTSSIDLKVKTGFRLV